MTPWYVWAFDGVAGAAVVGIGIAVYQRYSSKQDRASTPSAASTGKNSPVVVDSPGSAILTAPVTDSQVAVGNNITQSVEVHHHHSENGDSAKWTPTKPTPPQIIREIWDSLPFNRDRIRENYTGLSVVWETSIANVTAILHGCSSPKLRSAVESST